MGGVKQKRVIVIGGGPAGLFAAINAAQCGARVILLEKGPQPGRKLCASGGGRGNVTNTLSEDEFIGRFGRNGRFALPALRALSRDGLLALLTKWGVPCRADDGFHYFPVSNRAGDVLDAACSRLSTLGVEVRTHSPVSRIEAEDGRICGVRAGDSVIPADAVILAAGGASYPGLGGSRAGYELAEGVGHGIVPLVPGLVGLRTRETWPHACAGVTIEDTELRVRHRSCARRSWRGTMLFTHGGLSGPVILDASAFAARILLEETEVLVEFKPTDKDSGQIEKLLVGWRRERGKKLVQNLVGELVPRSLAAAMCGVCKVAPDTIMARLTEEAGRRLVAALDRLTVRVAATEGFEQAMVTSGGVSLKEVDPATLESKLVGGLHLAGEILDLDGPCGGFNLQWCFSSGWLAGTKAMQSAG